MDHSAHLLHLLGGFGPDLWAWGLPAVLFATGLVGGFAHCAGMCAPFVLAQLRDGPQLMRAGDGVLLPYHLGRLTTYAALGAVVGGAGQGVAALAGFRPLAAAVLALAAVLFAAKALADMLPALGRIGGGGWARGLGAALAGRLGPLLARPGRLQGYRMGLWLGFLPCGFLYAALAVAAAAGDPLSGALAMAAFALGTAPSLILVGTLGAAASRRWRGAARRIAAPVFLVNAVVLGGLAVGLAG
ncbi:MAG TPA: sulfite exporter TauE/SafE family protein [Alphaproteobacteria bacterium]|nr:sulfite exporter TauE/SafE family protein [Alphaproteobacteria bacterium]